MVCNTFHDHNSCDRIFYAYAQATKSCGVYMELPPGIRTKQEKSKDYVLKLLKNPYRKKQAGHIWNQYMTHKFKDTFFQQSLTDECAFYHDVIISLYTWVTLYFGE
ncbi:LOW QUALITY PROTEIN: hypothetical protein ACHAW6_000489 [Cyclotella cf. meneghiniana]